MRRVSLKLACTDGAFTTGLRASRRELAVVPLPFQVGDRTGIHRGPCAGLDGTVQAIDDARRTATLLVFILGREVSVEVPIFNLSRRAGQLAMRKRIRRFLAGRDGVLESYLASWHGRGWLQEKLTVRVDRYADRRQLTGTVLDLDDNSDWQPTKTIHRDLTDEEWNELDRRLCACSFWQLPATDPGHCGLDGETWTLDGVREGRYHSVIRWSSWIGESFGSACTYFAILAGIWPYSDI